ncbi:MAG TPA: DUF4062 domain-containing protein [Polyangia bacterium]|jgi:hypothetical protein
MKRKLQIFVSSTYRDLLAERQAAVEAILRAGHIPAGMELFAAGDKSQLETICRWIDESDVYMLILGSRYGSLDPASGRSYTQLEYEYALATGKRSFAVVLSDAAIDQKVQASGRSVIEDSCPKELIAFRSVVTSKICRMVDDYKDIKLAIHETLLEFLREYSFDGWVSGKHLANSDEASREIARLVRENGELRAELQSVRSGKTTIAPANIDFDAVLSLLNDEKVTFSQENKEPITKSAVEWFFAARNSFITGISNRYGMTPYHNFLFFRVSPHLSLHDLTKDEKVAGVGWRTMRTTKKGNEFLLYLKKQMAASKAKPDAAGLLSKEKPTTESNDSASAIKPVTMKGRRKSKKTKP